MIKLKLTAKKGECWQAEGTYSYEKQQVELPAVFFLKPTDEGLEVELSDKENPCTINGKPVLSISPNEAYPIPFKKTLKKGAAVDIATKHISHFNVKK